MYLQLTICIYIYIYILKKLLILLSKFALKSIDYEIMYKKTKNMYINKCTKILQ